MHCIILSWFISISIAFIHSLLPKLKNAKLARDFLVVHHRLHSWCFFGVPTWDQNTLRIMLAYSNSYSQFSIFEDIYLWEALNLNALKTKNYLKCIMAIENVYISWWHLMKIVTQLGLPFCIAQLSQLYMFFFLGHLWRKMYFHHENTTYKFGFGCEKCFYRCLSLHLVVHQHRFPSSHF